MNFVCRCTGDESVGDYNYALIAITPEYMAWLRKGIEQAQRLKAADDSFYGIEYFDYQATYYRSIPDNETEPWDGELNLALRDEAYGESLPTSATTVVVQDDSVIWKGCPKHSQGQFETATVTLEMLDEIERELQQPT